MYSAYEYHTEYSVKSYPYMKVYQLSSIYLCCVITDNARETLTICDLLGHPDQSSSSYRCLVFHMDFSEFTEQETTAPFTQS